MAATTRLKYASAALPLALLLAAPMRCAALHALAQHPKHAQGISLYSPEGVRLLHSASHAAPFWQLFRHLVAQTSEGGCGPTTAAMMLNTMASQKLGRNASFWDEDSVLANPCAKKAWFDGSAYGSLEQVQQVLACHDSTTQAFRAEPSSAAEFREALRSALAADPPRLVSVNYARDAVGLDGCGHHSPVGAFDASTDRVLVLDVKKDNGHPPRWYLLQQLFDAMNSKDKGSLCGTWYTPRGYLVATASSHFTKAKLATRRELPLLGLGGRSIYAGRCSQEASESCLQPPPVGWRVVYFDAPNRGECLRLLLSIAMQSFEDVRLAWPKGIEPYKSYVAGARNTPLAFDQVPLLQYGQENFSIVETAAAMQYGGIKTGLAPESNEELCHAESASLGAEEMRGSINYGEGSRASLMPKYIEWMGHFERWLSLEADKVPAPQNVGSAVFLAGNRLSFADVHLYDVVTGMERGNKFTHRDRESAYPRVTALVNYIHALPSVIEYTLKRDG